MDANLPERAGEDRAERGFLLNATGETYRRMAVTAARSLKRHHPDIPIDYYTDEEPEPGLFDRVYMLADLGPRPRFEALRRSRFDRTLMLDVDIVVIAPMDGVFEVLERFDLALAHDQGRNSAASRLVWRKDIPHAFPQFNGGLVGIRASDRTRAFIDRWEAGYVDHGCGRDQPALREILWQDDTGLRVATLPPEYNLWDYRQIDRMGTEHSAPRMIHYYMLKLWAQRGHGDADAALKWTLGQHRVAHLGQLIANDRDLRAARGDTGPFTPAPYGAAFRARDIWLRLRDLPRKIGFRLGRLRARFAGARR